MAILKCRGHGNSLTCFDTKLANGRYEVKQAIINANSIVFGRNDDILASMVAQFLTSRPFADLCRCLTCSGGSSGSGRSKVKVKGQQGTR